jgi:hypothetical protein
LYEYALGTFEIRITSLKTPFQVQARALDTSRNLRWWSPTKSLLGLAETCRQTYHETKDLHFALNFFSTREVACFKEFVFALAPRQRDTLRTIHIRIDKFPHIVDIASWAPDYVPVKKRTKVEILRRSMRYDLLGLKHLVLEI